MDTSNFKEVFESPKVKELTAQVAALKEQLSEANKERAWMRRKLEIPEDTGFLSGDVTLAGTMHNVWSGYRGYHNYIAAEKCDDKMGKIARQSVEIDSLKEQVAQLELEKEYRYVEQILRPIRILLKVAECAESMADNSEEMEGEDGRIHVGTAADFDELSDALDLLDELPDDKPGYVLGGAAKAAWALHAIIGDTNG